MSINLNDKQILVIKQLDYIFKDLETLYSKIELPQKVISSILAYLKETELIEKKEIVKKKYVLTSAGINYVEIGFPEYKLIKLISEGLIKISEIKLEFQNPQEFNYSIIWAKKKKLIEISKDIVNLKKDIEEIKKDIKNATNNLNNIEKIQDNNLIVEFLDRKLIKQKIIKKKEFRINKKFDKTYLDELMNIKLKDDLTIDDIKSGSWRNYKFKSYNITEEDKPPIYFGRTNAYFDFLDDLRDKLLSMGFEEYFSPIVDLELYNCDLLFMPQDHVARGIHDLFQIDIEKKGIIRNKKLFTQMKKVHLNGSTSNSKGWGYTASKDISENLVLRSQTTCTSAHFLEVISNRQPNEDIKMMCIDICFRPEKRDKTHSFEFRQCEGIITGDNLSIKHLLGILTEICHSLGISDIKFMPGYFPFTEPSVSGFIKHPKLGWIEALPGGIFRPEVCNIFNYKKTVLAYGIGVDRLAMAALGIDDIRELYSNNIEQLRNYSIYRG